MASNPSQPLNKFFEEDIVSGKRSNFNVGYKNRFSADFFYLYPAGLWDIPADSHFTLDLTAILSSNPTLAPVLGKLKFRAEAYFVEKAAYVHPLRNNELVPINRDVPFPTFGPRNTLNDYSSKGCLLEFLQMYPSGWNSKYINGSDPNDSTPHLNAIPFLMYYDIYRNYYINPQDNNIPIRTRGYYVDDPNPIEDTYVTRELFDEFINKSRSQAGVLVDDIYYDIFNIKPFPTRAGSTIFPDVTEKEHALGSHYGLLRRTLNNDFFTSFMSNDNVSFMNHYSTVLLSGSSFNMEQVSLANRNWRIATRSLLWGNDWRNYNKVHYGVNLLIPYGKPQFLGSISSDVNFNDVISQSQNDSNSDNTVSSNKNLGSRAGIAFGSLSNDGRNFIEFNTKDEGYLMVLVSLVPEVDYFQGIDPMYFKINLQHSWMQEYNSVGMQDFHRAWATVQRGDNSSNNISWQSLNTSLWKVPIWFEYMAKYNQLHGDFTQDFLNRYWTFSRPFDDLSKLFGSDIFEDEFLQDGYYSTYGLPEMYNYIFANVAGQDNFQIQVRFEARLNCMLDKQVISYL